MHLLSGFYFDLMTVALSLIGISFHFRSPVLRLPV